MPLLRSNEFMLFKGLNLTAYARSSVGAKDSVSLSTKAVVPFRELRAFTHILCKFAIKQMTQWRHPLLKRPDEDAPVSGNCSPSSISG